MIRNDKQLKLTKDKVKEFEAAVNEIDASENVNPYRKGMQLSAINYDIQKLNKEINDYERLKRGEVICLHLDSYKRSYEALIKARIAKGWTQAELAEKVNLKEQQIQRYEATNYTTASLPRINEIIYALGINISLYVSGMGKPRFQLPEEYTEERMAMIQKKASKERALLQIA